MADPDYAETLDMQPQGQRSRWAASEITFGPVGRIVATLLVVGVVLWLNRVLGVFFLVLVGVLWQVVPQALRDIWRPVRRSPTEQDVIRARAEEMRLDELPPTPPANPISERQAPRRW